jgi:hypothetical protein
MHCPTPPNVQDAENEEARILVISMPDLPGMEDSYPFGIAHELETLQKLTTGARAWLVRAGDISWPKPPKGEMHPGQRLRA